METYDVWLIIILMAVVTAAPRLLPVWLMAKRDLSANVRTWLSFVPVAVIAAMLAPQLVLQKGALNLSLENLHFWTALPTLLIAYKTRNLAMTIISGVVLLAAVRFFMLD